MAQKAKFIPALLTFYLACLLMPTVSQAKTKEPRRITVSAAVSLKEPLQKIFLLFQGKYPQFQVAGNFAGSGPLKTQIEQGAPVDIFIPASSQELDELIQKDKLVATSRIVLAFNTLLFVAPKNTPMTDVKRIEDISAQKFPKLAIGDSSQVPVGRYARQALERANRWIDLERQLIPCANARQVLDYVSRGEVDGGFIYASDLAREAKVKLLFPVPQDKHDPIVYPAAVVKDSSSRDAAQVLLSFLTSSESQDVLINHGFIPARGEAKQ